VTIVGLIGGADVDDAMQILASVRCRKKLAMRENRSRGLILRALLLRQNPRVRQVKQFSEVE
jgi:hypothetical protein